MLLPELKEQVRSLPVSDRLELVSVIIESLRENPSPHPTEQVSLNR